MATGVQPLASLMFLSMPSSSMSISTHSKRPYSAATWSTELPRSSLYEPIWERSMSMSSISRRSFSPCSASSASFCIFFLFASCSLSSSLRTFFSSSASCAAARSSLSLSVRATSQAVRTLRVSSWLVRSKGNSPILSFSRGSAPRSSSSCTTWWCPWKAALCRAVRRSLFGVLGSLPRGACQSSRQRATSRWPLQAASERGVFPRPSLALGSASLASSFSTSASSPSKASSRSSVSSFTCSLDFWALGGSRPAQRPAFSLACTSEHTIFRAHMRSARSAGASSSLVAMMSRKASLGSNFLLTSATRSGAWHFVRSWKAPCASASWCSYVTLAENSSPGRRSGS
mmetsp:Transcript_14430/g.45462  ORF Transcript_14430/g.45462 Transcript_14430/m.45462 type:complete len:344 (-) Transcript_14430:365-1396(-)